MALNRSPSTTSSKVPPWSSVRLLAMDSPRPEPSVVRDSSPRTKRSISRSGGTFRGSRETFFTDRLTLPFPQKISIYTRFTDRAPVEALLASTRSSVSFLSRWDFRSSTSMYCRAVGSVCSVVFKRFT